ncbi:Trp repressor [Syntrophomonas zehnderi OL-4]|uniref:Trp repressor n=1 Tax=Syntrophomonas zehnderi OL-4 TaxID=690567 RepID=A0A0E3W3T4_9FIRM|nr:YerC/YecD family TrpR-related protein [Syntrophomonas zehnderi]CFY03552.1 Trp repressor [Syntrophomonas zehnderi OL-4]
MSFTPHWKDKNSELLVKALLSLKTEEEVWRLLDDLCTIAEVKAMTQRIHVAKLLFEDTTYNIIARETGASTATISRVNRCLNYGADGYRTVLDRLKKEAEDEKQTNT